MEKFALLFRGGRAAESPGELQSHTQKWLDWVTQLRNEGKYVGGEPLHKGGKFIAGKNKSITDGPFTESKDIIGGFFILNAASLEEATRIAGESPDLPYGGTVEIRQVIKM
jgi:hypothetical protein